jgi:hypothetical protein
MAVTEGVAGRNPYDNTIDGFAKVWNVDNYQAGGPDHCLETAVASGTLSPRQGLATVKERQALVIE